MQHTYTLAEARLLKDTAVVAIEAGNVLAVGDGSRFREVESNIWRKVACDIASEPVDNVGYVSASHHSGGVIVRPLYLFADGQWTNMATGRKAVFDELA